MQLTIAHDFLPKRPTVHTSLVMDHFGVGFETGQHVIADRLELPIEPGDIVCFTGPSGSGKSSLLHAAAEALNSPSPLVGEGRGGGAAPRDVPPSPNPPPSRGRATRRVLNIDELELPDVSLVDALGLPAEETLRLLSLCGLGEARLLLRSPRELSDGQRFRFRLALALARRPAWIVVDEFTATLDRTLAKVIAFNVRRLQRVACPGNFGSSSLNQKSRTLRGLSPPGSPGFLLATTHTDILADLQPTLHVRCRLDGRIDVQRDDRRAGRRQPPEVLMIEREKTKPRQLERVGNGDRQEISFANELRVTVGSKRDWPRFAQWHYRSHRLGIVRFVTLLKHGDEPIGICVFTAPPLALSQRKKFFGLSGTWSRVRFQSLNRQLVNLSRVVLHPTYRGAGIAAAFIRESCAMCPFPWIESLTQMGSLNPFFEKAGFVRVGKSPRRKQTRQHHSALYGTRSKHGRKPIITQETHDKSRNADPVYFVFDNRGSGIGSRGKKNKLWPVSDRATPPDRRSHDVQKTCGQPDGGVGDPRRPSRASESVALPLDGGGLGGGGASRDSTPHPGPPPQGGREKNNPSPLIPNLSSLSPEQQAHYLDLLARGASPAACCKELRITPTDVRRTLAESREFRAAVRDVAAQLSQNVATALYHAAMKGNVPAQALWLKHRPPPEWQDAFTADETTDDSSPLEQRDLHALTDHELLDLARAAGLALPSELADGADAPRE